MAEIYELKICEGAPFGNILLNTTCAELLRLGFAPGDSVDVRFSSGEALEDVPFLSGCVLPRGMVCLNAHEGMRFVRIEKRFGRIWDAFRLTGNVTGQILLRGHGKYGFLQSAFSADYSVPKEAYSGEDEYANYRALAGGSIRKGMFYRSAGSLDSVRDKIRFIMRKRSLDSLMERDRTGFVLNMSYSREYMDAVFRSGIYGGSRLQQLYDEGSVYFGLFPADYDSPQFRASLASALRELVAHRGPYLIQCRAGLDRTGFLCCLLEALAGAELPELMDDYMRSYDCLCGIAKETDRKKYDILRVYQGYELPELLTGERRFPRELTAEALRAAETPAEEASLYAPAELEAAAEGYLRHCGMSEAEIGNLKELLRA